MFRLVWKMRLRGNGDGFSMWVRVKIMLDIMMRWLCVWVLVGDEDGDDGDECDWSGLWRLSLGGDGSGMDGPAKELML